MAASIPVHSRVHRATETQTKGEHPDSYKHYHDSEQKLLKAHKEIVSHFWEIGFFCQELNENIDTTPISVSSIYGHSQRA